MTLRDTLFVATSAPPSLNLTPKLLHKIKHDLATLSTAILDFNVGRKQHRESFDTLIAKVKAGKHVPKREKTSEAAGEAAEKKMQKKAAEGADAEDGDKETLTSIDITEDLKGTEEARKLFDKMEAAEKSLWRTANPKDAKSNGRLGLGIAGL